MLPVMTREAMVLHDLMKSTKPRICFMFISVSSVFSLELHLLPV